MDKKLKLRRANLALTALALVLGVTLALEALARFGLGLGDPPLYLHDDQLEYRHRPGRYRRFGNDISYNQSSMRSGPLTVHKTSPLEYRVLVLGDSVVNGGAVLDDQRLATAHLLRELKQGLRRPVYVGNISAGSWGPTNQAAYLEKFGWWDADLVVLVESAHDVRDASTFERVVDVGLSYPGTKPWSALAEGYQRYWSGSSLVRLLPASWRSTQSKSAPGAATPASATAANATRLDDEARCRVAFQKIADGARSRGITLLMALFGERDKLGKPDDPDYRALSELAAQMGAQLVDTRPAFAQALRRGDSVYRDGDTLHPSAAGHRLLANQLLQPVLAAARQKLQPSATPTPAAPSESAR